MRKHVIEQAFEHHEDLRLAGAVGMDNASENRVIIVAVNPIELISPNVLNIARIDPAVTLKASADSVQELVDIMAKA